MNCPTCNSKGEKQNGVKDCWYCEKCDEFYGAYTNYYMPSKSFSYVREGEDE